MPCLVFISYVSSNRQFSGSFQEQDLHTALRVIKQYVLRIQEGDAVGEDVEHEVEVVGVDAEEARPKVVEQILPADGGAE